MTQAVVALGANLGDRAAALQHALDELATGAVVRSVSAIFETAPVGGPRQPDYYNAVAVLDTELSASDLLALALSIEAVAGRERSVRWGPRTLDVDLLVYDDTVSDDAVLTLPHPRAHTRAFVLMPWHEVDPDAVIPGRGAVAALLGNVDKSGIRRLDRPVLHLPEGS
jgi:2-amino-4-hydroxy-6-hydroxymethyldihydropteridine diphosphokinase